MKLNKKAFTLIELLVVVLIIGILASVAVPSYQKAVEKSRVKSMLPLMRSIYKAQKAYYLANNAYATTFDELDIEPPAGSQLDDTQTKLTYPNGFRIILEGGTSSGVKLFPSEKNYFLKWYYNTDVLKCWASTSNTETQKLCRDVTGTDHKGYESGGFYGYTFKF